MPEFLARHWRGLVVAAAFALGAVCLGLSFTIGQQVERTIAIARASRGGGPVEALLAVARSREAPLGERDRAIWALGQLGAEEARPVLESMITGGECDHDSLVCQRELKKAIALCSGGLNVGAVVWRHGDLAVR